MPKEDILTKFKAKDYNNKLEEILEKKEFSNDVKNLLLNMLYKIEAGYNDYRTVKIDILEKKIIIEEIVRYVYENCSTIKLIEPKNDDSKKQKKYKIDKSKNAIMSYPNERDLLKAIYAISYNYIKFYGIENMIEESLSKFINIGYNNDIFEIIRPLGSGSKKSSYVIEIAKKLISDYNGKVPNNREYLESLPGVGRKTCNVLLSELFDVPAIAVDTHVERVTKRLGLVEESATVGEVEDKLMEIFPKDKWGKMHKQLVLFGRYTCVSKNPKCSECLFTKCPNREEK